MISELYDELIFGYETFRSRQVAKKYEFAYVQMIQLTQQKNIIYFYIKKNGTVAYKCWGGEHKEFQITLKCLSEIRDMIFDEHMKIKHFVLGASWQGMPINFVFENTGYGLRATDMNELSRTQDTFGIKPVFEKIFEALYSEIPELRDVEKYPIRLF